MNSLNSWGGKGERALVAADGFSVALPVALFMA